MTTVELQALSRRNLNILLAEYPEVGDELKAVAKNRASIAKKGKEETAGQVEESEHDSAKVAATSPLAGDEVITASTPTLIATPPPLSKDGRYLALVEKEVDRIVSSISIKIRSEMGLVTQHQHPGVT